MSAASERVAGALAAALPGWYGEGARPASLSPPRRHPWSFQFALEAATPRGLRRLVVKIPRWEEAPSLEAALAAGPQDGTRREFAVLQQMAAAVEASGDRGLAAVVPVAYLEELNAVVTEQLDAVPLYARLGNRPGGEGRHTTVLGAAGRLLALYHREVAGAYRGALDGAAASAELAAAGCRLGRAAGPRLRERLADLTREAAARHGSPAVMGAAHGDFNPANVLVTSDERVALLDPNLVPGPLLQDAAKMLVALRMRRARVLTLGRWDRRGLAAAAGAFLAGYGPHDEDLLRLLRAVATAARGEEMTARLTGRPVLLRRPAEALLGRYLAAELSVPEA